MPCVSKSAFLKPLRQKTEQYPLPEYGEGAYVVIQALTSKDLLALQEKYGTSASSANLDFAFDLLSRSLVDDSGSPIFVDAGDAKEGVNLSVPAMESLVEKVMEVSGIKVVGDGEKN